MIQERMPAAWPAEPTKPGWERQVEPCRKAQPAASDPEEPPLVPLTAKSVAERVFMVLLSFDPRHRAMTMSEISRRSNLPVATVHRLLQKLESMGAVERASDRRYGIGPLMWRMGILAPTHDVIGRGARPLLMSLSARTNADVRVLSYFDEAAMCVDEILAASMSADSGLGEMHPLHNSAGGIAIAAQLSPGTRQKLRLTRAAFNRLEQRISAAREDRYASLTEDGFGELAVALDTVDRPPMSIILHYPRSAGTAGRHDAGRLAALQETARSLTGILNERTVS